MPPGNGVLELRFEVTDKQEAEKRDTGLRESLGFPGDASGKEPVCQCKRRKDTGLFPRLGRSPGGGGNGNLLQYSCLENPMDRGAWRATVHGVAKSQTQLKRLSMHGRRDRTMGLYVGGWRWQEVQSVS